jgi:5-methyltetrahydrofolate--homocysteine methyltransferase
MADMKAIADAIINGNRNVPKTALQLTEEALAAGVNPKTVFEEGLMGGMAVIIERFKKNEVFIPEVLISARAFSPAMEKVKPLLLAAGEKPVGKVVIGTVKGDLHDIGKNLVSLTLKGQGFDILDLGTDVAPDAFVKKANEAGADIIAMSALLTTTMPQMKNVIAAVKQAGAKAKTMIGGAPVTQDYAKEIGADGYAPDAATAVDVARKLVGR